MTKFPQTEIPLTSGDLCRAMQAIGVADIDIQIDHPVYDVATDTIVERPTLLQFVAAVVGHAVGQSMARKAA